MPTITSNDVLTILRTYLVGQADPFVRHPSIAGPLPPLLVEPDGGPRGPGAAADAVEDHPTLIVNMGLEVELAEVPFDSWRRRCVIEVHYLSKTTGGLQLARGVDDRIARALVRGRADYGYGWVMGTPPASILIMSASIYGGLSRVSTGEDSRDHQVARYVLEVQTRAD